MTLPTMLPTSREQFVAWCRGIDEGPWSGLAVPERITYPSAEMMTSLAAAAVLTERVRLATTIVVLPSHDEVRAAKQLATVDVLSDGRLTVGVGVGGRDHDYEAVGASTARRWQRLDDQVARMRSIWSGSAPFEGADPVGPVPVQAGGPPLIAGVAGPKATARAARWADGVDGPWAVTGSTANLARAAERVRTAWAEAGRTDAPVISTSLWYALGPDAEDRLRGYVYDYMRIFGEDAARAGAVAARCHDADALRATVDEIAAAGLDELWLVPTTADPAELERTLAALQLPSS
jgi:alkanesulfonate monooxygenase SsuD/methylene tetrahydromethanopterin reductase-like flavin-dependent oxidoreductase (luciferase family)